MKPEGTSAAQIANFVLENIAELHLGLAQREMILRSIDGDDAPSYLRALADETHVVRCQLTELIQDVRLGNDGLFPPAHVPPF